ncbi:MAG: alginate O-acetyltransferase [Rhizobium sp.]|nr:alginate O-acetyltransferase [Rhizobium sp.]MBX9468693.1 alginate O-acetyltransferase [Rhizobium sp.]
MPSLRQYTATLVLPAAFFGYALYANSALLLNAASPTAQASEQKELSLGYVIDGEATRDLDALYKNELPHRAASVGLFGNARYALLGAGRKGVIVGDDGWFFTAEEFKTVPAAEIEDAVGRIAEVKRELEARGIQLIVAPLPAKSDVYSEEVPSVVRGTAMAETYGSFIAALKRQAILIADTRPALLAAKPFGEVFLKSDTHWSPAGAKATAEAVQTGLQMAGITLASEEVTAQWQTPVSLWGDLTKFVTSPDYAPGVGLKEENILIYRTTVNAAAAGADIFGDDTAVPIMLVGTSYSANENWSFADFLRQSLRSDVVNVAKEGLGPGVPMMDLLAGAALDEMTPTVVVWEFPIRYLGTKTLWERDGDKKAGGGNV